MTFLFALCLIMGISLWLMWKLGTAVDDSRIRRAKYVVLVAGSVGYVMGFICLFRIFNDNEQAVTARLLSQAFVFASLVGLATFTYAAVQASGGPQHRGSQGAAIIAAISCGYLLFASADHLRFYWDEAMTGYVDGSIASKSGVRCHAGFVLVKLDTSARTAIYRCPSNVVLGSRFDHPLVPWPTYREGSSAELYRELEKLHGSDFRPLRD